MGLCQIGGRFERFIRLDGLGFGLFGIFQGLFYSSGRLGQTTKVVLFTGKGQSAIFGAFVGQFPGKLCRQGQGFGGVASVFGRLFGFIPFQILNGFGDFPVGFLGLGLGLFGGGVVGQVFDGLGDLIFHPFLGGGQFSGGIGPEFFLGLLHINLVGDLGLGLGCLGQGFGRLFVQFSGLFGRFVAFGLSR